VQLQGVSRFGKGCCARNLSVASTSLLVDSALLAFEVLLSRLGEELSLYFGSAGGNERTVALLADVQRCWDFGRLAYTEPDVDDVKAFLRAFQTLRPTLRSSAWPTRFPYVQHVWPSRIDLAKQYRFWFWRAGGKAFNTVSEGCKLTRGN
jgi:hypothetical protein